MSDALVLSAPIDLATLPRIAERVHHLYSPSSLGSLEACPCFQNQQSDTPHERTTAGTLAHGVAESGEDDARLSDEDAEAAVYCMDFVAKRKAFLSQFGPVTELKEIYLRVDDRDTTAGYADVSLIAGVRGEIVDYKYGTHKVEPAPSNLQGIAYAIGLMHRYAALQQVQVWFVQPHANYITDAIFLRSQIPELLLRIRAVVARAKIARTSGTFENANPTTPNCLFCAHVGRCPALLKIALKVGKKFHPLVVPESLDIAAVMDPQQTQSALQLASTVKTWAEAFRASVLNKVLCREAALPDGYKIESRSKREIVDEAAFRKIALVHLSEEEYQSTLKPSLTKTEKIISAKAPRGSKTDAVKAFSEEAESAGATQRGESYTYLKVEA